MSASSAQPIAVRHARAFARRQPVLIGVDFTSAPTRRKPIAVATGHLARGVLHVDTIDALVSFDAFDGLLASAGPWLGGFDMPFGLPRELVAHLGWPLDWPACIAHYSSQSRAELRLRFKAFCDARPVGGKFAHRQTDGPAGSSPSMKWVNPPVAWMLHAGAIRLVRAGVTVPGMMDGDPARVALEVYPALAARSVSTASYKSDTPARQTPARERVRQAIVDALVQGNTRPGLPTHLPPALRRRLVEDASGDSLDAVLCLVQTAWALGHPGGRYSLPDQFDPLEGWIVGA